MAYIVQYNTNYISHKEALCEHLHTMPDAALLLFKKHINAYAAINRHIESTLKVR